MKNKPGTVTIVAVSILGCIALLYFGGVISQLLTNYHDWIQSDGMAGSFQMKKVNWGIFICIPQAFTANGLKGILGLLIIIGIAFAYFKLHDKFDGKDYDPRGFKTSKSGVYGTASWMSDKEMRDMLEITTPAEATGQS